MSVVDAAHLPCGTPTQIFHTFESDSRLFEPQLLFATPSPFSRTELFPDGASRLETWIFKIYNQKNYTEKRYWSSRISTISNAKRLFPLPTPYSPARSIP